MNYNTGTSAYKYDEYMYNSSSAYELDYEQRDVKYEQRRTVRINNRSKKKELLARMVIVSLVTMLICAVGFLYSRVMVIYAANEVNQLKNELATISSANNKKSMEIERSIDLKKVEEIAISKYNMQRPDKNQTVYVNVTQQDYAEVVKPEGINIFKTASGGIKKVLAYLN